MQGITISFVNLQFVKFARCSIQLSAACIRIVADGEADFFNLLLMLLQTRMFILKLFKSPPVKSENELFF